MVREALKIALKKTGLLRTARRLRDIACASLEGAAAFLRSFFKTPAFDKGGVRRVLAIRLDRIGDLVLTTPALRAVKESYPNCRLSVLVRRTVRDLVIGLPFVDEVIVADDLTRAQLVRRLREGNFDVSLGFHPDVSANYLPWRAGIPRRAGYGCCGSGVFLTDCLVDDRATRVRHEVRPRGE
jgi:hypothetical protein